MRRRFVRAATGLLLAGYSLAFAATFAERDGFVVCEAEHHTDNVGAWEEVEGRNATAVQRGTTPVTRLILNAPRHPLAAGLSRDLGLPSGTLVPWGFAGAEAVVAWTLAHDPRKAAVFGYERGAKMPRGIAPARRLLLPAVDERSPESLHALFDAGVRWAADGAKALLLTNQIEPVEEEVFLFGRLAAVGFDVRLAAAAEAGASDAHGCGLIVIPAPVRVEKVAGKFDEVAVPVATTKSHVAQLLGMVPPAVPSRDGDNAMLIRGGAWSDHLRFAIYFTNPGKYRVWLLGQSGGDAGTDEVKVFLGEPPSAGSEHFFEMALPAQPGWASRATARRPANRKTPVPAEIHVPAPGWHALYLAKGAEPEQHGAVPPPTRRYPNWRIDRVVLARDPAWQPAGDGPPETLAGADAPALPREFAPRPEWRPQQVWALRDGAVVIEAEALDHHPHWALLTAPRGFSGAGYLEWRGPNRSKSIEDLGGNDDHLHVRQGAPEEWLILRLRVEQPGAYRIDVRNHHRLKDGDNDVWFARVGQRGTEDAPIKRMVDSHRDGTGFTWLDGGGHRVELRAGLNEFYLGGRSVGFGVDRIAVYQEDNDAARRRALDLAMPAASPE